MTDSVEMHEVLQELTPVERIKQAFLQFGFAIKLMNYVELKKVDKDAFDSDTVVLLDRRNLHFHENWFRSYDDMILAAQNNCQIVLGFSAITLDSSLDEAGLERDPRDWSPRGQLRTLVYMIRCAFAHDMMTPRWRVDPKYQHVLNVQLATGPLRVDLPALNGQRFDDGHIGGISSYFEIKDAALQLITESQVSKKGNR